MQNSEPAYLQNYLEDTEEKKMKNRNSCFPDLQGAVEAFVYFLVKDRNLKIKH